jgi:hypothetical protein
MSPHLRGYQQEEGNLIYSFESFDIEFIPHCQKVVANILANAASKYTLLNDGISVEIMFRPSILDNVTN